MDATHKELKSLTSEFLVSGPPELDVRNVKDTANDLIAQIKDANDNSSSEQRMADVRTKAASLLQSLGSTDVVGEFRQLSAKVLQEQLLVTASHINELKSNGSIQKYPEIVKLVLLSCPEVVPSNSKIFNFLNTTVQRIRQQLLSEFHQSFESHLVKSEELKSSVFSSTNDGTSSWESFLSSARGWMLAFVMVSLLPAAARGGGAKQLLEAFQDCLDVAFTPLWGRFFFHLSSSREGGSMEQILWTFEYTHTFVHLLLGFCSNLTKGSSDLVQTFPGIGFRQAGEAQIIEKTCRFMRSHVAECLVIVNPSPLNSVGYSSSAAQICISLVEHSLLLDHDIHKVQHGFGEGEHVSRSCELGRPVRTPLALPVSAVFCANRIVRDLWLHFDHTYFLHSLLQSLGPKTSELWRIADKYAMSLLDDAGGGESCDESTDPDQDVFADYFPSSRSDGQQVSCFGCIFSCLILFHKAYQRYSYLPPETHDLFCAYVLEPLLLSVLGLVMFRTNNCSVLKTMFECRRLPLHVPPGSVPPDGQAVLDTTRFLDQFLMNETGTSTVEAAVDVEAIVSLLEDDAAAFLSEKFCGTITPPGDRFAGNWALLQAWVRTPDRRYITKKSGVGSGKDHKNEIHDSVADGRGEAAGRGTDGAVERLDMLGFRAYDVVEKAFALAEEAGLKLRDRKAPSFQVASKEKKCDLADVINFARRESESMADKLRAILDDVVSQSDMNDIYLR